MCIAVGCNDRIYSQKCFSCCVKRLIKSQAISNNEELEKVLIWLQSCLLSGMKNESHDNRDKILIMYIFIPSFFHELIRELFYIFFEKKSIKIDILKSGKWLHKSINIKKPLIESIFVTQGINLGEYEQYYYDAINFFTSDSEKIHRNKVAHSACESLKASALITINDLIKNTTFLLHLAIYFEVYINNNDGR